MNLRFDDLSDAGSEIESDSSVSDDESMVELSVSVEKIVVSSLETVGASMDVDAPEDPNKCPTTKLALLVVTTGRVHLSSYHRIVT